MISPLVFWQSLVTSILSLLYVRVASQLNRQIFSPKHVIASAQRESFASLTRHRASTSMYSLTFCVRVMLPERHHGKPTVQAAAVILTTPPVDGQLPATPTSHIRRAILRTPPSPAGHRPAVRAHPAERLHCVVISWNRRKLVTRVRIMLP